jgi:aminopeptidase N
MSRWIHVMIFLAAGPAARAAGSGVPLELAQQRVASVSDVRYELSFELPEDRGAPVRGSARVRFQLSDPSRPLILDFRAGPGQLRAATAPASGEAGRLEDEHIVFPASALRAGENTLELDFDAGDGPLNRRGELMYTLFVPARAREAFPCFDQPDLRARFRLSLDMPESWTAVSNTPAAEAASSGEGRRRLVFAETESLPTYLFAFAAGRFEVAEAVRGGRTMRLFHRETDADKLGRNLDALFDLHAHALEWLERYTGIAYPFQKFDFVAVPAFQYQGMEHPGAILYRDSVLLLDPSATQEEHLRRASVIAHETAHMWFGDLVTMRWFDDVWMKEVFANFFAAKIVNPSFPELNHELRFLLTHHPAAYGVDRTAGANPIRQPLENLAEAGSLYGAIIYNKAPIVMRQLERLLGEAAFQAGIREYLERYRFANAAWPELIDVLDSRTEADLQAWSHVWVGEPGRPSIRAELSVAADGTVESLELHQTDPAGRGRLWDQALEVVLVGDAALQRLPVRLAQGAGSVAGAVGLPAPRLVLPAGDGFGYGLFELDEAGRGFLLSGLPGALADPVHRGAAWLSLWDSMLEGRVAPAALVDLAIRWMGTETDELLVERVLADLRVAWWRFLGSAEREERAPALEELLWRLAQAGGPRTLRATAFKAFRDTALTPPGVERLRRVWAGELQLPELELSETDLTELALELAVRRPAEAAAVLQTQLGRIQNPDRRDELAFVRPALDADEAVRDAFFESLKLPENRSREKWVLQALVYLHHPLRAPGAVRYLQPSLELLEEIQRTGDIFFPKGWLDAMLSGHSSAAAADIVRKHLEQRTDLPPRLRAKLLQSADLLFRAAP